MEEGSSWRKKCFHYCIDRSTAGAANRDVFIHLRNLIKQTLLHRKLIFKFHNHLCCIRKYHFLVIELSKWLAKLRQQQTPNLKFYSQIKQLYHVARERKSFEIKILLMFTEKYPGLHEIFRKTIIESRTFFAYETTENNEQPVRPNEVRHFLFLFLTICFALTVVLSWNAQKSVCKWKDQMKYRRRGRSVLLKSV